MNIVVPRLLALILSVITLSASCHVAAANSLSEGIDNIFGQLVSDDQPEFLDPDDAFIVTAEAVAEDAVLVRWEIADGYYLYKDKFQFSFEKDDQNSGIRISSVQLPEGKLKNDPDFGSVWVNYHEVEAQLTLARTGGQSGDPIDLLVKYQGCKEDVLCYPPISKILPISLINSGSVNAAANTIVSAQQSEQDIITERLSDDGFLQNIIIFFGFGLLLALTPCVFPMIPILSGIIVGQGTNITTLRAFYMSLVYVLAMALTYAVLGIIAGSFAFNLQAASQNVWVISAFSGVFVLLALSMFGFYELQLPGSWQNKLAGASENRGGNLRGVAVMGVLSAIIVGPCIAPPLAGALLYISQTGDAVLGGFALFAMGLGMGVPLLIIGVSTGKFLPKAGAWMQTIKHIFGVLMLGVAVWFMERVLPGPIALMLWALLLIVSAIYMGALDRTERQHSWQGLWRGLGLAMLVYGVILIIGAATGGSQVFAPLQGLSSNVQTGQDRSDKLSFQMVKGLDGLESALTEASKVNKYVMLDFYADWCITCKEMEHGAFSDPRVHQALRDVVLLKTDVTENDAADKALLKRFGIFGPPAILFFNQNGIEEKSFRVVGFMKSEDFLQHVDDVLTQ